MANVTTIRRNLATQIGRISGLTAYPAWPGQYHVPAAVVVPIRAEHEQTFGSSETYDLTRYDFEIVVLVPLAAGNEDAQRQLDEFSSNVGSRSVRRAIVTDRTLGGVVSNVFFDGWGSYEEEPLNETIYLTQRLALQVWAT